MHMAAEFLKLDVKKPWNFNLGTIFCKGQFLYYVRISGWVGGPENGNFPLLFVVKMSLLRWVGGSEKPQNTLT